MFDNLFGLKNKSKAICNIFNDFFFLKSLLILCCFGLLLFVSFPGYLIKYPDHLTITKLELLQEDESFTFHHFLAVEIQWRSSTFHSLSLSLWLYCIGVGLFNCCDDEIILLLVGKRVDIGWQLLGRNKLLVKYGLGVARIIFFFANLLTLLLFIFKIWNSKIFSISK